MRDRFRELQALALQLHPEAAAQMHQGGAHNGGPRADAAADLEGGPPGGPPGGPQGGLQGGPQEGFLCEYFKKVQVLSAALAEIGEKTEQIQTLKAKLVEATNPDEEKGGFSRV